MQNLDGTITNQYSGAMSKEQITTEAMALPLSERVLLAQTLWESIDLELPDTNESVALAGTIRRDEELTSGRIHGRTHEQVMRKARRTLKRPD